ncbi:MAG: hypothetical protein JXR34_10650 [Bacteroidales bacterium]|nr:hypothetical protein [Bacteroidales bacterium]
MRYIITGTTSASLVVEYDEDQVLTKIEFKDTALGQVNFMLDNIPALEIKLETFAQKHKLKISRVQEDLSFEAFWTAYKYKVGKKARTERLWKSLSNQERELVFISLPRYQRFVAFKNQESAYAETFLNNKMWENEYILK